MRVRRNIESLGFTSYEHGWDGATAEIITEDTVSKATSIAHRMLDIGPEPFVAPAPTGELLLQWDFEDGSSAEVFVGNETDFPDSASVTREDTVHEVALDSLEDLRSIILERTQAESVPAL